MKERVAEAERKLELSSQSCAMYKAQLEEMQHDLREAHELQLDTYEAVIDMEAKAEAMKDSRDMWRCYFWCLMVGTWIGIAYNWWF